MTFQTDITQHHAGKAIPEPDLGRQAQRPTEIPAVGWLTVLKRVYRRLDEDNISILTAGVSFYAMLAIFPALAAVVSTYALIANPTDVQQHFSAVSQFMPREVSKLLSDQIVALSTRDHQSLSFSLITGIILAVWSAHRGIHAMVNAITIAYREKETRGYFKLNALTFVMTFGAVGVVLTAQLAMIIVPAIISFFPTPDWITLLTRVVGWCVFLVTVAFALGFFYRFAPPRKTAKWKWLSLGALIATLLWFVSSILFSYYVTKFGTYNETYGALSAFAVLLMWFYLTSFSIILGAMINAELEHQTLKDTTTGTDLPMGERGAFVADNIPGEIDTK